MSSKRERVYDSMLRKREHIGVADEDRELIESGIRSGGFETLAFYKFRRFKVQQPFPGKWGIFYLWEAIEFGNHKELGHR